MPVPPRWTAISLVDGMLIAAGGSWLAAATPAAFAATLALQRVVRGT